MLQSQEGRVEDDAERDEHVETGIGDEQMEPVLPAQPRLVPQTARRAALAVAVRRLVWWHRTRGAQLMRSGSL